MRYHEVLLPLILSTLLFAAAAWVTFPLDRVHETNSPADTISEVLLFAHAFKPLTI